MSDRYNAVSLISRSATLDPTDRVIMALQCKDKKIFFSETMRPTAYIFNT